jgi:hypothetical protein
MLDERGFHTVQLLTPAQCQSLVEAWDQDVFRKAVIMERHAFGRGEYRYFADPLPELVAQLRASLYEQLLPIARAWAPALGVDHELPPSLTEFQELARAHGQSLPTPLLLRYGPGDYNCLHQDLYGAIWFPLQVVVLLSEPGTDFEGGELVLVEQRPRAQSRPQVIPLRQGEAAVIPCHQRPRQGKRGLHRVTVRHGVSEVRRGQRHTLGLIFHDAATG